MARAALGQQKAGKVGAGELDGRAVDAVALARLHVGKDGLDGGDAEMAEGKAVVLQDGANALQRLKAAAVQGLRHDRYSNRIGLHQSVPFH